jgi:hypothetical protein
LFKPAVISAFFSLTVAQVAFGQAPEPSLHDGRHGGFLFGEIYLRDGTFGRIGCFSCDGLGSRFSPLRRYLDRLEKSDFRSPCSLDSAGTAIIESYAGGNKFIFSGRFTRNMNIANGICAYTGPFYWAAACEELSSYCSGEAN